MKGIIYKFNPKSDYTEEQMKASGPYALMLKLERGEKPTIGEMSMFGELFHSDSYRSGTVRLMGWFFDFRPYFRRFLVNEKYYEWREVYAYNRTMLRKLSSTPSHILEIVELKNRKDGR